MAEGVQVFTWEIEESVKGIEAIDVASLNELVRVVVLNGLSGTQTWTQSAKYPSSGSSGLYKEEWDNPSFYIYILF